MPSHASWSQVSFSYMCGQIAHESICVFIIMAVDLSTALGPINALANVTDHDPSSAGNEEKYIKGHVKVVIINSQ